MIASRATRACGWGRIEAVLCVPIGDDLPRGALYLQNCAHGTFTDADRTAAETFARHLAPLVDRRSGRWRSSLRSTSTCF